MMPMPVRCNRSFALCISLLAAGTALALPAQAQQFDPDRRFHLRLSAFNPEASLRLRGDGQATSGARTEDFGAGETLDFGSEWRPRGAFAYQFSERQALVGNYYDYERQRDWSVGGDWLNPAGLIEVMPVPGLPAEPVQVPTIELDGKLRFALASLNYEYSVVSTDALTWGVGLGVTHARLQARGYGGWDGTDEIDAGTASGEWKKTGWSPGVHTRLTWRPAERWNVGLEGQYLDTRWGDFLDERGHFERAGLVVEYRVSDRVGVHVGYDWFRLKLRDDYVADFEGAAVLGIDPVDVAGTLTGQVKVHGPMAGVTFHF
jgi:opacity protein-like surface antigen